VERSASSASMLVRPPAQQGNGHNEPGVNGVQVDQALPSAPILDIKRGNLAPRPSIKQPSAPPPLHPEIRSVVGLTLAQAHKVYFSGPLVKRVERQADGQRPSKDEGWKDVWAQLGGTTLSIWDMKAIEEASKAGKEVPPTYINMTDAVREQ
jgi:CCR4-NOT transcriptional complex subunit CAF120